MSSSTVSASPFASRFGMRTFKPHSSCGRCRSGQHGFVCYLMDPQDPARVVGRARRSARRFMRLAELAVVVGPPDAQPSSASQDCAGAVAGARRLTELAAPRLETT